MKNPNTIIIKNKFYKDGLTEKNIYDYYENNKNLILNNIKNRDVYFYLFTDMNKFIIKRKFGTNSVRLSDSNYKIILTGRIVSIISSFNKYENFGIVDIDSDNFNKNKECAIELYDYLISLTGLFNNIIIKYTGKDGFHIVCYFKNKKDINKTRLILKKLLNDKFKNKYDILNKRRKGKINLDIGINKFKGGFITIGSLSQYGLISSIVDRHDILHFKQENCKINIKL
jgi:hypothetical protein